MYYVGTTYNDDDNIIIVMYRYISLLYYEERERYLYTLRKRYAMTFNFTQRTVSYRFNYLNFQHAIPTSVLKPINK